MRFNPRQDIIKRLGITLFIFLASNLPFHAQTSGIVDAFNSGCSQGLALRTNLLYDLALMPNLGAEWHFGKGWSVLVDYAWANYRFDSGKKRYGVSQGSAEIRHYLNRPTCEWPTGFYLGLHGLAGNFNLKFSDTGRQGNHLGLGLSAGYQVRMSSRWFIDLGAAAGWLHVSKGEKYRTDDNLGLWTEDYTRNSFAPLALRATLVFCLFNERKGGSQ